MANIEVKDDQLQLFFDIWELLKTRDIPVNFELDEILKQLSFAEKEKVLDYFESVLDQPAFKNNPDVQKLRSLIVDWYSSNRTIVTRSSRIDPFSMSSEELDELIASFGFPYANALTTQNAKALFLLDLINLYNKKGTPESLITALNYFGLQNIKLSEWWIYHVYSDDEFVARSRPIYPVTADYDDYREVSYEQFISDDPYWRISETKLRELYEDRKISLPSISPHLTIDASIPIINLYVTVAIIAKKMQEEYTKWTLGVTLPQDLLINRYGLRVSFLEAALAIGYVFSGRASADTSSRMYYANYTLDSDLDGEDDIGYDLIIDEYNNLIKRPSSRLERTQNLETLESKFTRIISDSTASGDSFFITEVDDYETYLNDISPALKYRVDIDVDGDKKDEAIESLLTTFDAYLSETLGISEFSFGYLTGGSSVFARIQDVITFFKPIMSRLRELLSAFLINDPLGNSQVCDDVLTISESWSTPFTEDESTNLDDSETWSMTEYINDDFREYDCNIKDEYFIVVSESGTIIPEEDWYSSAP